MWSQRVGRQGDQCDGKSEREMAEVEQTDQGTPLQDADASAATTTAYTENTEYDETGGWS